MRRALAPPGALPPMFIKYWRGDPIVPAQGTPSTREVGLPGVQPWLCQTPLWRRGDCPAWRPETCSGFAVWVRPVRTKDSGPRRASLDWFTWRLKSAAVLFGCAGGMISLPNSAHKEQSHALQIHVSRPRSLRPAPLATTAEEVGHPVGWLPS